MLVSPTADDFFGFIKLFSENPSYLTCPSNCQSNGSVKWCVRLAYLDGNIETCISLDDDQNPVYENTCDAQYLGLEEHLSLPSNAVRLYLVLTLHTYAAINTLFILRISCNMIFVRSLCCWILS